MQQLKHTTHTLDLNSTTKYHKTNSVPQTNTQCLFSVETLEPTSLKFTFKLDRQQQRQSFRFTKNQNSLQSSHQQKICCFYALICCGCSQINVQLLTKQRVEYLHFFTASEQTLQLCQQKRWSLTKHRSHNHYGKTPPVGATQWRRGRTGAVGCGLRETA